MNQDNEHKAMSILYWLEEVDSRLADKSRQPLAAARQALEYFPDDPAMLQLSAFAALVEEQPELALRYLKKLEKYYVFAFGAPSCKAVALAQLGKWPQAQSLLRQMGVTDREYPALWPGGLERRWVRKWLHDILHWKPKLDPVRKTHSPKPVPAAKHEPLTVPSPGYGTSMEHRVAPLPRYAARIPVSFNFVDSRGYGSLDRDGFGSAEDFILRLDLAQAALFQTFDELLCLPHLKGVSHYWYQVETARKVLKQFRGRVLLADEVGLGKTIEAGIVLKEYMLRGMVWRVLVLTPASLVGQWREEMETKFDIQFTTSQDPLLNRDAAAFWACPRIIASIAAARREAHSEHLLQQDFDLVIVDEAHHLKSRSSRNWKLVDGLRKRFLLLLSATPIQNSLIELYNILTLLKPGIFKTEREFRSIYVKQGSHRLPSNREGLQELMRDVMVRNTRALVDVRLPPRRAATVIVEPSLEESECYQELSRLMRSLTEEERAKHRMALHHLLEAAGSSPRAARASLARFVKSELPLDWQELQAKYSRLDHSAKSDALIALLERNPSEKKMVFVRFRETLLMLGGLLDERGIPFACFEGSLSGPEKDRAVEDFRERVTVLLSSESGGEGRNLQFCNTMVNFDLPWNPQLIEQRIGRIHRIGQTREVFVFNLAVRHTIEEQILRILDEKIHMFELVVGEIQSILGEMEEDLGFADLVFSAWVAQTEEGRQAAFNRIGDQLAEAQGEYEAVKAFDAEIFGDEFEVV